MDASEKLQNALKLVGSAKLARRMKLPKATVNAWQHRGVPDERTAELAAAINAYADELKAMVNGCIRGERP